MRKKLIIGLFAALVVLQIGVPLSMIIKREPIDRYYMEETAAPRAEQVYREHIRREKRDAYATAKVKDGFAVVDGLYIGEQRIEDVIRQKGL